jgi:protein-arginine deiminase
MLLIRRESGHLTLFEARTADPTFKTFLETQAVQPILSFDTSWLHVGHVDEVAIFVPANGPKGFKLLMSSTELATAILTTANAASAGPVTSLFRGKKRIRPVPPDHSIEIDAVDTVANFLATHQGVNDEIQAERLKPIEERLLKGLALDATDIVHLPVYYDVADMPLGSIGSGGRTSAKTPHMINLQVISRLNDSGGLERHVIVPRPFGPRMSPTDAAAVLTTVHITGVTPARLAPLVGHWHWARRGTLLNGVDGIAATFSVPAAGIRSHANNAGKFTTAGAVKNNWDRIWIPEDNVDLFEACTQVQLEDIGVTVHWVDDWDMYHRRTGEIHCGTNVVRTPPEAAPNYSGPYWWDHYSP